MSDITYVALIMSISNYHSNLSPPMLHNLSREAAAVRVGGIWNGCLLIMTESWVAVGIIPAQTSCHCTHCAPHYKSTILGLLWAPILPQCMPPILPPCWDSAISPQMGEGRVLLTNKVTPGLVGWASLTFTRLTGGAAQFTCRLM